MTTTVECLGVCDEYVYDIETADGTFHANGLIVKNTDSIYTKFTLPNGEELEEEERVQKIYDIAIECAQRISATFRKPIMLEMEDFKYPIALFSKKCYVYREIVRGRNGELVDNGVQYKGVQMVRRDNCGYVKDVSKPIVKAMMYGNDKSEILNIARSMILDLMHGKVPMNRLSITKSLKEEESYKVMPAHVMLARKIEARDPGSGPKPGSRMAYVFIENSKAEKDGDKMEDYKWAVAHPETCKPDILHYVDKQLTKPLATLLQVVITKPDGSLFPLTPKGKISTEYVREMVRQLFGRERDELVLKSKKQRSIRSFFAPVIKPGEREIEFHDE